MHQDESFKSPILQRSVLGRPVAFRGFGETVSLRWPRSRWGNRSPKRCTLAGRLCPHLQGEQGMQMSGQWQNIQAALLRLNDHLRRILPASVYLKKVHSTGSPDLCTLHWSGTRCRMNCLASASLSPAAHRSKMSRTGLSMQFLTVKLWDLAIMQYTKNRQTLGFLAMKTAREKEPETLLTWIMSVS